MSKSFDINKAKQNIDAKKPEIQESEKKLEGLSKSKKALFDARMVIEGLDIDESVKATIVESLNSSYEEVKSEGQSESKKLNDILKDDDDTRREIMDARDDTQKAIDNLEGKGSILETFGISNAFEKSKIQAEQSLQELGELQEQVTADINKIMDVGHKLDALWNENSEALSDISKDYTSTANNIVRTWQQTEEFTKKLLEKKGYIDGNKFSFMKVSLNGQSVLCSRQGSPEGYQKPDKYKLDENSGVLYIVEDKNYSIEDGISSVLDSMVDQAENRIRNCLNVTVPQGLMNNRNESYINNLVISFSLDVHGHYFHKDGSPVLVSEFIKKERAGFFKGKQTPRKYNGLSQRIQKRLLKRFSGDESKLDNVYIRVGLLFGNLTNKNLDVSNMNIKDLSH